MRSPSAVPVEQGALTLFVAGGGQQAQESILRARRLADRFDDLSLRVVDVLQDPAAAESALVLVVPSLVLSRDGHRDQIVAGDLPAAPELAEQLGLEPSTHIGDDVDRDRAISQIWESNPDGIVVIDADGTICFLNEASEALLGRAAADLLGTPLEFHPGADGPTHLEILRAGRMTTVELRTAPVVWEGRPAVMATLRDVTERNRMVEELLRTRAELTRSNEDLERFAATVAHDLRTPLTLITGSAKLLGGALGAAAGTDERELLDTIVRSVSRMTGLLDAVLAAAHAGADLDLRPTELGSLVSDAEAMLGEQIAEAGATVEVEELPTVLADPTQMLAVFQNLLSNAIKYRSPDRPLRIAVSSDHAIGGGVVITVRDNGIGIEPADRERVFTMLDRLPRMKHRTDGHGIGLAVCRRVIERHGGRIWVDEATAGSSFRFVLPGPVVRHA